MADLEGDRDKFSEVLELYEGVKKRNVWSPTDLDVLQNILGDTHPIDFSIRKMFRDAAEISGYGPSASAQILKLGETIIQSLPGKIGKYKREYAQRYNALNTTSPPTQLRDMQPDYFEKRAGSLVTRFYKTLDDPHILQQARTRYGTNVTVLQYRIPRGLRPKSQTSGQFIKTISYMTDFATGDEISVNVVDVMEDVNRKNSGHVIIVRQ